MRWGPKQSVMHKQKVRTGVIGKLNCRNAGIHSGGNPPDSSTVLDLKAVDGAIPVPEVARTQQTIAMMDESQEGNGSGAHELMEANAVVPAKPRIIRRV